MPFGFTPLGNLAAGRAAAAPDKTGSRLLQRRCAIPQHMMPGPEGEDAPVDGLH